MHPDRLQRQEANPSRNHPQHAFSQTSISARLASEVPIVPDLRNNHWYIRSENAQSKA